MQTDYNRKATIEGVNRFLWQETAKMASVEVNFVDEAIEADVCVLVDVRPNDVTGYVAGENREVVLVNAQQRSNHSYGVWLTECKRLIGDRWNKVRVVRLQSEDCLNGREPGLLDRCWDLNRAVFEAIESSL